MVGDKPLLCGASLPDERKSADKLSEEDGVTAEVIDLLTISPLEDITFCESVQKTGRAVIVNEAPRSFGPAAEITNRLVEKSFWYLEAPIQRVTGFDVIVPLFAYERTYLPDTKRILKAARDSLDA